jgi:uncharacterized DUF497 family protein
MLKGGARISWEVPHARTRAKTRGVSVLIAERVIQRGSITKLGLEADGTERWTISGRDTDGRPVDVVVTPVPPDVLRVITVIRTDE